MSPSSPQLTIRSEHLPWRTISVLKGCGTGFIALRLTNGPTPRVIGSALSLTRQWEKSDATCPQNSGASLLPPLILSLSLMQLRLPMALLALLLGTMHCRHYLLCGRSLQNQFLPS